MDEIFEQLLQHVGDEFDKTPGYLVHDLLKAVAHSLAEQNLKIVEMEKLINVDNLTGELLAAFVDQRKGIVRTPATHATGEVTVSGNGTIRVGDLFETRSGIQFKAEESKQISGQGVVKVKAVKTGSVGNIAASQITQMPVTLTGITAVTNAAPTAGGYAEESDDSLRERYYIATRTPPTSANVYHYLQWAKEVSGVGDAKVFPVARGDNTVEVVIIDQDRQPADSELVKRVQTHIDLNSEGLGNGEAPIGAKCYVISATALSLQIAATVTRSAGYEVQEVKTNIQESLKEYLRSIAFKSSYVSYAKIGEALISTEGVEDYSGLTVNNATANVSVGDKQVAILGGVTIG